MGGWRERAPAAPGRRARAGGQARPPLPRRAGPRRRRDRHAARTCASNDQRLPLRPRRVQEPRSQGALARCVLAVRRIHVGAGAWERSDPMRAMQRRLHPQVAVLANRGGAPRLARDVRQARLQHRPVPRPRSQSRRERRRGATAPATCGMGRGHMALGERRSIPLWNRRPREPPGSRRCPVAANAHVRPHRLHSPLTYRSGEPFPPASIFGREASRASSDARRRSCATINSPSIRPLKGRQQCRVRCPPSERPAAGSACHPARMGTARPTGRCAVQLPSQPRLKHRAREPQMTPYPQTRQLTQPRRVPHP